MVLVSERGSRVGAARPSASPAPAPVASRRTWQACIELSAALKHPQELGGPHAFVSHLPVHQDGSCNGLQHYAALSRDECALSPRPRLMLAPISCSPAPIPLSLERLLATRTRSCTLMAVYSAPVLPLASKALSVLGLSASARELSLRRTPAVPGRYGAKQVNLTPSDKPQDVYTGVATILQHKVRQRHDRAPERGRQPRLLLGSFDTAPRHALARFLGAPSSGPLPVCPSHTIIVVAMNAPRPACLRDQVNEDLVSGDEDAKLMASLCHQRITRKIVKQTVMTSVYGVTFVGARDQIHRRLVEQGEFPEASAPFRPRHPPSPPSAIPAPAPASHPFPVTIPHGDAISLSLSVSERRHRRPSAAVPHRRCLCRALRRQHC